jgi:hypothetical protein
MLGDVVAIVALNAAALAVLILLWIRDRHKPRQE